MTFARPFFGKDDESVLRDLLLEFNGLVYFSFSYLPIQKQTHGFWRVVPQILNLGHELGSIPHVHPCSDKVTSFTGGIHILKVVDSC